MPTTANKRNEAAKHANVQTAIIDALTKVDRPGEICAWGDRPVVLPGLEVEGLGTIRLPLGKGQARKLAKLCRQAPYGKGTETVVDTDVRRVWELDPTKFEITSQQWKATLDSIVAEVQQRFGLDDRKLSADLYKLLLYDEGGFFLPHRDGEKLDRMVATLVVALPAVHQGGELIVSHDGRTQRIEFTGAAAGDELSYAAFYADCQHEVRPVKSGHRLCLVYNLTLAKSRGKGGILAPAFADTATTIAKVLNDWRRQDDAKKLAVTLEHRYSQKGLKLDSLKGVDRARADVLFDAAEQAECVAHLALVTRWESGSAEGGFEYDPYYRRDRWSDDEDDEYDYDDETADASGSDYEMGEVYEESLSASGWIARNGKRASLGVIDLVEEEIIAAEPLADWAPSTEEFEGYTGNAGMTLERWYRRAAVVIWPQLKHFAVLCDAGTDLAIGGLEPMVAKLKRAAKSRREEQRQECLTFASAIIDTWQTGQRWTSWTAPSIDVDRAVFPRLLCELDDPDVMRRFLSQVVAQDSKVQIDKTLPAFCNRHVWGKFESELAQLMSAASVDTITRNAELLRRLCAARDKNAGRIEVCQRLCETTVGALVDFDNRDQKNEWELRDIDRAKLLEVLIKAMLAVDANKPLEHLINHALAEREWYELTDAHLTAIFALEARLAKDTAAKHAVANSAVARWLRECRQELEKLTARPPDKPTDFRRVHVLSCKCGDCQKLSAFLADPNERRLRLPLAKERRKHMHRTIESNRCDVTHVTERRGRPYTLVCTKTKASYESACELHQQHLKNLARVRALEKKLEKKNST